MTLKEELVNRARALAKVVVFMALALAGIKLAQAVAGTLTLSAIVPHRYYSHLFYVLADAALLLVSWAMLARADQRSFRALGMWFYAGWMRESGYGVLLGALLLLTTTAGVMAAGGMHYLGWSQNLRLEQFIFAALFLLIAAALEEFSFRGYAFQRLVDAFGPLGAVVTTAAIFGVMHLNNPNQPGPLSFLNTMLAGVLLAVAYLKTRALWLPIALHWSWNFFEGPLVSSRVSGLDFQPRLFRAEIGGPDWLSGGGYGLEASAVLTVACVVAVVWLARTKSIFPSPAMAEVLK